MTAHPHRPPGDTAQIPIGAPVRLDLLSDEPFIVAELGKTHVLLRHAHGWNLKVPKWRVSGG